MTIRFKDDDSGVSSTMEFMLSFIVAAAIFSYFVINLNNLFMGMPEDTVARNQYLDVGNDISTKLIDTYLVAPDYGDLTVNFDMPEEIVGQAYKVKVEVGDAENIYNREVKIISSDESVSVFMVLNGASSTIPMGGETNSNDAQHVIRYHYDPHGGA